MEKQRNLYIDLVKGILIILVVLGHAIQFGNGKSYFDGGYYFDNPLFKIIYSFHMPLFMLISGYLFYFSMARKTSPQIFKGKLISLFIPIITYALIIKIYDYLIGVCDGHEFFYDFFRFTFFDYHLWFLWSVLLNTIIVTIISKINDSYITYIFIGLLLLLIPEHRLHAVYTFVYPFFIIGYWANKFQITKRYGNNHKLLFAICISFFALLAFYNKESYVYTSGQCINRPNGIHFFVLDFFRFVTGITGCVLILVVIKWYFNRCYLRLQHKSNDIIIWFTVLGRYSMGIYCFQDLLFNTFIRSQMPSISSSNGINILTTTITFLTVLLLSTALTHILRKNKYTNIFLLGGR